MLKTIVAAMPHRRTLAAIAALAVFCVSPARAGTKTVTLSVPGMHCAACPVTVKAALTKVKGVEKVEVSFEKKEAVVTYDDAKTNVEALKEACKNAGYPATEKQR
jgi:mercuric ion binding protein